MPIVCGINGCQSVEQLDPAELDEICLSNSSANAFSLTQPKTPDVISSACRLLIDKIDTFTLRLKRKAGLENLGVGELEHVVGRSVGFVCRHACLKMKKLSLIAQGYDPRIVNKLVPKNIGYSTSITSFGNNKPASHRQALHPPHEDNRKIIAAIDENIKSAGSASVYVTHPPAKNGDYVHVIEVSYKEVKEDGTVLYHFYDPASKRPELTKGVLTFNKDGVLIKEGRKRSYGHDVAYLEYAVFGVDNFKPVMDNIKAAHKARIS